MGRVEFLKSIWKDIYVSGSVIQHTRMMIIPETPFPNVETLDYETAGRFLVNTIAFLLHIELTLYAYGTLSYVDRDPKNIHKIEQYLFKNLGI